MPQGTHRTIPISIRNMLSNYTNHNQRTPPIIREPLLPPRLPLFRLGTGCEVAALALLCLSRWMMQETVINVWT